MYDEPQGLKNLIKVISRELREKNWSRDNKQDSRATYWTARLIAQVELGLELLTALDLRGEPIAVLWVILSGTPLRDTKLQHLTLNQRRMIANARLILPGYAGRYGWENALQNYIDDVGAEFRIRRYDFDSDKPETKLDNCFSDTPRDERVAVYQEALTIKLDYKHRTQRDYAEANVDYEFKAHIETGERWIPVRFTQEQVQFAQHSTPWFSHERERLDSITIETNRLESVAGYISDLEGNSEWLDRYHNTRLHDVEVVEVENQQQLQVSEQKADHLTIKDNFHLAGIVSSGKSTLMTLIAALFVYEFRVEKAVESPKRITLVVGDSASSIHLTDRFNRWFCEQDGGNAETTTPVAVPLLGKSTKHKHLAQLHDSRDYERAIANSRIHWGERFVNATCPLQGQIEEGGWKALNFQPLQAGAEPCSSLKAAVNPDEEHEKEWYLCPMWSVCPSQQRYRDMLDAQIWITTPGALGMATLPGHIEDRPIRVGDLVYEQSDLVVFDEVDTIVEWFDRLYAQEMQLTSPQNKGILDELDKRTSDYLGRDRSRPAPSTVNWIEAQRNFITPVGHILHLLQKYDILLKSTERGFFTAHSLLYRLARRIVGLAEYGRDGTNKQELEISALMDVFDFLMRSDPLAMEIPSGYRADRKVTLNSLGGALSRLRKAPKSDRDNQTAKYDVLVKQIAFDLADKLNKTMNIGDSTQNKRIIKLYSEWLADFVPDIDKRLEMRKKQIEKIQNNKQQRRASKDLDTPETLVKRLEFAMNAILVDRFNRSVFYGWHNRPSDIINEENPSQQAPTTLLNILPLPANGRQFGIYHLQEQGTDYPNALSSFGYTSIGRDYVTNFHQLRADVDRRAGPHVLAMSGTSYLPDSVRFHYTVTPRALLKPSVKTETALKHETCKFTVRPMAINGEPISISGAPLDEQRGCVLDMTRQLVGSIEDAGAWLADELHLIHELSQHPEYGNLWQDRRRLLLLVNSYKQCKWIADEMFSLWHAKREQIFYLERGGFDNDGNETSGYLQGALRRVDIELFAQTGGEILIAPLQAIGRGFNILNDATPKTAAFGSIYFLTRPMPHPHDIPAIAQEMNRRIHDWFEDSNFQAWQNDGIYERGKALRRIAGEYWRRVESRYGYRSLRDEKDFIVSSEERLHMNPRRDLAATTAGVVIQAVGRLMRGGVPFRAHFVDASWAPNNASRIFSNQRDHESLPRDTAETSLLAAMIEILTSYAEEDEVAQNLYQLIANKLEQTDNFEWEPY